jgi:gliding-associated putative ABC transporter substrate-binding component GldG
MKLTKSTITIRLLLYIGIFLALNLVAGQLFFRLDFTADKRYTLSNSTKDILKSLGEQDKLVTITAYFSRNLPPELSRIGEDLKDLLAEYESYSDGRVVYEFIDPAANEEAEQKAGQAGIFPLDIQARERDEIKVVRGYLGAVIKMGNQQEVIPVIQSGSGMEFMVSSNIKKLSVTNKPKVGILQGHGEPGLDRLQQAVGLLETLYEVDTFSLASDPNAWSNFKTVVVLAPSETFPPEHLAAMDQLLASGGRLLLGLNAVGGDLQGQQMWDKTNTGLENWLSQKGIVVEQAFLTDVQCAQIQVQRRQGFFVVNQPAAFPYFPRITNFPDHPITQGLEEVLLQFASPITVANADSGINITPIAQTTEQSGKIPPPTFFNTDKEWTTQDFAYGVQYAGVAMEGKIKGETESKMVVISDGDFPLNRGQQQIAPDNVNLLVNSIDWLTDDTGLIELRTRGVITRPLEKLIDNDDDTANTRTLIKYLNFFLPILIVIIFGILRFQRQNRKKKQWMAEDYS